MIFKRCIISTLFLALAACTVNPFSGENHLTGSAGATAAGAGIGAGTAALLGASKSVIALSGLGGAVLGYYLTTVEAAAGGIHYIGGQVFVLGDYATIELPTDHIFEENSADLLPEAGHALASTVQVLQHFPNSNILVSGNMSGFGTARFEHKLSEARAQKVAAYLWMHGVSSFKVIDSTLPTRKLTYVGYGNYFPIANTIRNASIRQNSRIQITAYPSKNDLDLPKNQKFFANIGGLDAPPIQQTTHYNVDNAFKGESLPETGFN